MMRVIKVLRSLMRMREVLALFMAEVAAEGIGTLFVVFACFELGVKIGLLPSVLISSLPMGELSLLIGS